MNAPKKPKTDSKSRHKKTRQGTDHDLATSLLLKMEECKTAEDLNSQIITPFIQSLVTVCDARGYVLNIYGDHCNLVISPEDHAEQLFKLIEAYLDEATAG